MISIVLYLQNKLDQANNKVLGKIHKVNDNFSKLKSELSVTKHINSLLSRRLVNMERQCSANAQYSRRKCLGIIVVPSEIEADALEGKFMNIFEKLCCNIPSNRIEACHREQKELQNLILKSIIPFLMNEKSGIIIWLKLTKLDKLYASFLGTIVLKISA